MIPIAKEVYGLATGYSPSRPDLQAAQRIIWAANAWVKLFNGEKQDVYKLIYSTANAISTTTGLPVSNVLRDARAIITSIDPRIVVGEGGVPAAKAYERFADALAEGDEAQALELYNALIKSGKEPSAIRTGLTTQYKENETIAAAAEAKTQGDLTEYEKLLKQAETEGMTRDGAIKAVQSLTAVEEVKEPDAPAKTYTEMQGQLAYETKVYTYTKTDLMALIEAGKNTEAKRVIDLMLKEGKKKETIASDITDEYKDAYIALSKTNRSKAAALKAKLLTMYSLLGYSRADKAKDIDKWLVPPKAKK